MTAYNRMSAGQKRTHSAAAQRETSVTCPRCAVSLMPADLDGHSERCKGELPEPHPLSRWLKREHAMRLAPGSLLDRWRALGLLRMRADGAVLECDLVQLIAWSRALGAM